MVFMTAQFHYMQQNLQDGIKHITIVSYPDITIDDVLSRYLLRLLLLLLLLQCEAAVIYENTNNVTCRRYDIDMI